MSNVAIDLFKTASEGVVFDPTRFNTDQTAIQNYLNKLLSVTPTDSGADSIAIAPISGLGDVNTNTVYEMLVALKTYVDSGFVTVSNGYTKAQVDALLAGVILGQIPDLSLITSKYADASVTNLKLGTDVKIGSLAAINTTDKSSVVAGINEHLAENIQHYLNDANTLTMGGLL